MFNYIIRLLYIALLFIVFFKDNNDARDIVLVAGLGLMIIHGFILNWYDDWKKHIKSNETNVTIKVDGADK